MNDSHAREIEEWVTQVFRVLGISSPPLHLVQHYAQQLLSNLITPEQVKQELTAIVKGASPDQPPGSKSDYPAKTEMPINDKPVLSAPSSDSQQERYREFVNQLYITYAGRLGDPATMAFVVRSLVDKSYSLQQTEYFVKFSKEAKAFQKSKQNQEADRAAKTREFVTELCRVYLKQKPDAPNVDEYVRAIVEGERTLQEVEDEFKLLALSPPSSDT